MPGADQRDSSAANQDIRIVSVTWKDSQPADQSHIQLDAFHLERFRHGIGQALCHDPAHFCAGRCDYHRKLGVRKLGERLVRYECRFQSTRDLLDHSVRDG